MYKIYIILLDIIRIYYFKYIHYTIYVYNTLIRNIHDYIRIYNI